ncbi:hypothetical protein MY1884_007620 [Beauveria asiatica]
MESLNIILGDSVCGRLLNYLSNGRLFSYHVSQSLKIEEAPSRDPQEQIMVAFESPDDPDIPRNWPTLARMVAGFDVMLLNFSFYAASAIFTPSILGIQEESQATTAEGTLGLSLVVIAMYAVSGVCGPILGPVCLSRRIKRWKTWTATLWLLSGITAFTTVSTLFFLPETLASNILLRRAKRLRAQTGNPAYQSETEMQPSENLAARIVKDIGNELKLACLDPVILFVNLHTMLVYGVLYLWFEFFPFGKLSSRPCCTDIDSLVFDGIYHFTPIQQGPAFFGILVGAAVSVVAYVLWLYVSYQPRVADVNVVVEPEARLIPGQIGAICIPICLFIFAWTPKERQVTSEPN